MTEVGVAAAEDSYYGHCWMTDAQQLGTFTDLHSTLLLSNNLLSSLFFAVLYYASISL